MISVGLLLFALGAPAQDDLQQESNRLIEQLRSDKPEDREVARRKLKRLGRPALPFLEKATRDSDVELAGHARELIRVIELMGSLSPRVLRAFPGIEEDLPASEDHAWTERFLAIRDLKPPGTAPEMAPLVERAIRGARTNEEKIETCGAAGRRQLRSAAGEVRKLLLDKDSDVHGRAAETLAELGIREAIPDIVRAIEREIRSSKSELFDALESLEAKKELVALLKHSDPGIRGSAVRRLGNPQWGEVVPDVLKMLQDPTLSNRGHAAEALGKLGVREAIPQILELLKLDDGWAQYHAIKGLAELKAKETSPRLIAVLKSGKDDLIGRQVRQAAANALGRLGAQNAIPDLIDALKDEDYGILLDATGALVELKAMAAVPALLAMTGSPEDNARELAVKTLGELGAPEAIPRLRTLLKSKDRVVVKPAIEALELLGAREAVPDLVELVGTKGFSARGTAAWAVWKLGGMDELPRMLDWLEFDDPLVRYVAVRAVARLAGATHSRLLMKRLDDSSLKVRAIAAEHLGKLGVREAIPVIEVLLEAPNEFAQVRSAEALCALGSEKGIPLILGYPERMLHLNALRRPEEWRRLSQPTSTVRESSSVQGLLEALARSAGLGVEFSSGLPGSDRRYFERGGRNPVRFTWTSLTLLEAIQEFLHDGIHVVVERDRIRILTRNEALAFWEAWAKETPGKDR